MNIKLFYQSLISDWNQGNAYFLRGIIKELIAQGHKLQVFEPKGTWGLRNVLEDRGTGATDGFENTFPGIRSEFYDEEYFEPSYYLSDADLAIVHADNSAEVIKLIGDYKQSKPTLHLLLHDTRAVEAGKEPVGKISLDLSHYDGILAGSKAIEASYVQYGWAQRVWIWHEAADTSVFYPRVPAEKVGDLIYIGDWNEGDKAAQIQEFFIKPVKKLKLKATVYGRGYPKEVIDALQEAGILYGNSITYQEMPEAISRFKFALYLPHGPNKGMLTSVPSLIPAEVMASGTILISALPDDSVQLWSNQDCIIVNDDVEMENILQRLLLDETTAQGYIQRALSTIRNQHTCKHRVDDLLGVVSTIQNNASIEANVNTSMDN